MTIVSKEPSCGLVMSAKSEYGTFSTNVVHSKTEDTCEVKKKQENNPENENATVRDLCYLLSNARYGCTNEWSSSPVTENHSNCHGFSTVTKIICRGNKYHRYCEKANADTCTHTIHILSLADSSFKLPNIDHSNKLRWVTIIDGSVVNSKNTHQILEFPSLLNRSNNVICNISLSGRLYRMINLKELNVKVLDSSVIYFGVSFNEVLVPTTSFMVYTALGVLYISFMDMQLVTEIEDFKLILNDLYYFVNDIVSTNCIVFLAWLNVFRLVRSTFRSLTNTKSDSQCVIEMSWMESEQPKQTENSSHEKYIYSIQEEDMCSYKVDISVRQMSHVPLDHVLSPLPSQELRVTVAEPTRNIPLKSQFMKQRCKVISDTVDLKSIQHIEGNKELPFSLATYISAESKHDIEKDENIDLIKELTRKHTTQPLTAHQVYTIAPVSRAQDEKANHMSNPSSDRPRVEMDSFHSDSIHHHGYGAHQVEDTHMTSAITPLIERQDDCEERYKGVCIEQNGSSVVQIDAPGAYGQVTSIRMVQHCEDIMGTECSNVTEDSSLPTAVSASGHVSIDNLPNAGVDEADIQRFEPLMQVINKIADGNRVPPQITMQYEMLRFCTLRSFPKDNKPYITRIAEAGFYYANNGDEVVCYCCARRKSNWQETDIPMDIHRQMNPTCSFLVRNSDVNVSIKMLSPTTNNTLTVLPSIHNRIPPQSRQCGVHDSAISTTAVNNTSSVNMVQLTGQDNSVQTSSTASSAQNTTQNRETLNFPKQTSASSSTAQNRIQTKAHGNFVQAISSQSSNSTTGMREPQSITAPSSSDTIGRASSALGIKGTAKAAMPKYPKYASNTIRLASFNNCGHIVISPERLAESGLFYVGFGDCVRCFQCGVGLRHWSEEDDPWIEHSRWRKECAFVIQRRGQEFVNLVHMAVQYSENDQDQSPDDRTTLPNEGGNQIQQQDREEINNLMHTDAAQSVLEMGYHPNIIRQAIRRVLGQSGRKGISAANLMEIIFEIEADTTPDIDQTVEQSATEHPPPQSSQNTVTTREEPGFSQECNSIVPTTYAPLPTTTSTNTLDTSRRETINENCAAVSTSSTTVAQTVSPHTSTSMLQAIPSTSSGAEARISRKSQILEQKKLEAENEKLKQQSICTTCKKNGVCIVFLPCGHLVTCEDCAPTVRYCTCGKYIKGTVRTYLA